MNYFKFCRSKIYWIIIIALLMYFCFVYTVLYAEFHNILEFTDGRGYRVKNIEFNQEQNQLKEHVALQSDIRGLEEFRTERFRKAQQRSKDISGPGEDGEPVFLTEEEQKKAEAWLKKEFYNVIASEKVAMDRRIPDLRHEDCKSRSYSDLPRASVVIVFCNEAPSGLLRTVHSVINRSPPRYLLEVILLDDFSSRLELGVVLEEYINGTWPDGTVKLFRSTERLGLIRAKIRGAELSSGDVIIFLDAHCETADHWLEPLLARIKEKPNVVTCPAVDNIDDKTLEYSKNGGVSIGGFTWSLHFTWRAVPMKDRQRSDADPIKSPTMAGGLLAVNREFFFKVGAYDGGMYTWGGENLEMSFRVWMCGGEVEFIPCSRVGHIFRAGHPYAFDHTDSHGYNSKRLAEVWMDDYKRLFYNHRRDLIKSDAGNLSERKRLREELKCQSFKWYLDNVFPEQFIMDENSQAYGMIADTRCGTKNIFVLDQFQAIVRNPKSDLCLDTLSRRPNEKLGLYHCSRASNNQVFGLSKLNELRTEECCVDSDSSSSVRLYRCHEMGGNQEWHYNQKTRSMIHSSGFCLDATNKTHNSDVTLSRCDGGDYQKWEFENVIDLRP